MATRIRITSTPYKSFVVAAPGLPELLLVVAWNNVSNAWDLSVTDNTTNKMLASSLTIVSGINLFASIPDWTMGAYFVDENNAVADPTRDNISGGSLFIGTAEEFKNVLAS